MPTLPQKPMQSLLPKPLPFDPDTFLDPTDPTDLAMADVVAKYGIEAGAELAATRKRMEDWVSLPNDPFEMAAERTRRSVKGRK